MLNNYESPLQHRLKPVKAEREYLDKLTCHWLFYGDDRNTTEHQSKNIYKSWDINDKSFNTTQDTFLVNKHILKAIRKSLKFMQQSDKNTVMNRPTLLACWTLNETILNASLRLSCGWTMDFRPRQQPAALRVRMHL